MTKKVKTQCKECKKTFYKREANKVFYCSKKCQFLYKVNERLCLNIKCSKKFYAKQPNQKLCSRECAIIYNSFEYKSEYGTGGRKGGLYRLRFQVFIRDDFTCIYCGRNVKEDHIKIECEHIIPKVKNGTDTLNNLTTSCRDCNVGKSILLLNNK